MDFEQLTQQVHNISDKNNALDKDSLPFLESNTKTIQNKK